MKDEQKTKKQLLAELNRAKREIRQLRKNGNHARHTEREIIQLYNNIQVVFDNSAIWLNVCDREANIVVWNKAAEEISGYSREEVIGNNKIWEWLYPDKTYRRQITQKALSIINEGVVVEDLETVIRTKTGEQKTISWFSSRLMNGGTAPLGSLAVGRDISHHKEIEAELLKHRKHLAEMVREQTHEIHQNVTRLQETIEGIIHAMARIIEIRDPYTAGHQKRVAELAERIAIKLKLPESSIYGLRMASLIHDIGKIFIPFEILSKPTPLTTIEFDIIKTHPRIGYDILHDINFPWPVAEIILQHHELLDGSGYPSGLKGEEIRIEARILAIADVIETMSSDRPYRPAYGLDKAILHIQKHSGVLYDPQLVETCIQVIKENNLTREV